MVSKKPVALSVGIINIDSSVEDKNNNSTYKIHDNTDEEVSLSEKVESNIMSPTTVNTDKKGSKSSEASPRKEVQTASIVYNTQRRRSSEDLNGLNEGTLRVGSKDSDKVNSSNDKLDVENLYNGTTRLRSKGADRVVSDKSSIKSSKHIETTFRSKRKSKGNRTSGKTLLWEGKIPKHIALDRRKMLSQ